MASREELYTALRNADAAGDNEGAAKLATFIQSMPADQPVTATAPVTTAAPDLSFRDRLSIEGKTASQMFPLLTGAAETALHFGSGSVAAPAAGIAGVASLPGGMDRAAGNVEKVNQALTYEPRSPVGKLATAAFNMPLQAFAKGANAAGERSAEFTGSPAVGAAVNTGIQFLPALLMRGRAGKVASSAEAGEAGAQIEAAAQRAKDYVTRNTSLDWGSLADAVKTKLTSIAQDAASLDKLDPKAVERQARLESLPSPVTATRGQLTRDPVQLRNEGNVSATDAGKPIRDIYQTQTQQLLQNLDVLKGKVKGRGASASAAETPEQVGQSVQDSALRAKLKLQQDKVKSLYQLAEAKGELQGPVSVQPIKDVIANSPDLTHLGWVDSWLGKMKLTKTEDTGGTKVETTRDVSLKEIEDLRQAAVAKAMNGGTDGYYAGKVINAIDQATDGAGGSAYKSARAARKAQALEFEDQSAVARLVENRSRTDRATALEDTWRKTVLGGSIEDLQNVKRSLLTGGDATTRAAGKTAWRDIRAQTIQHITNEATKSVTKYQDGTPNVTPASMERAIRSIGPDKLDALFGPGTVRQLNQIMEATRDVKTEPPAGFKGSPTFANAIAFLEKQSSKLPIVGNIAGGAIRVGMKLHEIGKSGRQAREAMQTPLDEAQQATSSDLRRRQIAEQLRRNAGAATAAQQQP